jgi:hypothetical protein
MGGRPAHPVRQVQFCMCYEKGKHHEQDSDEVSFGDIGNVI